MFDQLVHRYLRIPYILNARELQARKNPAATLVLLHGIGSSIDMWRPILKSLPKDIRVIGVDLLGFGLSPRTSWKSYRVNHQAKSVAATLFFMKISGPVIVVGHSLGSLVAIEFARRYPLMTRRLVLVSPPLYDITQISSESPLHPRKLLSKIHDAALNNPGAVNKLLSASGRYEIFNRGFKPELIDLPTFLGTLEASIINQKSVQTASKLRLPIDIITGTLDPYLNSQTIRQLAKSKSNITHRSVVAGHEIIGLMQPAVINTIQQAVKSISPQQKRPHKV